MGNPNFKLSDLIPNAWFYKLKNMNKPSKFTHSKHKKHSLLSPRPPPSSPPPPQCHPRQSYHITRELTTELPKGLDSLLLLHSPPRKSKSSTKSRKSTTRRSSTTTTSSSSCRSSLSSQSHRSKSRSPPSPLPPLHLKEIDVLVKKNNQKVGSFVDDALLGKLHTKQSITNNNALLGKLHTKQSIIDNNALPRKTQHFDIVLDVDKESLRSNNNINNLKCQLPPIITKNTIKEERLNPPIMKEQRYSPASRRFSVSSPGGIRLKINSPRIMGKKQGQNGNNNGGVGGGRKSTSSKKGRRSIAESFAVVKSSRDPQRDFRESMVEMIVQNNLKGSKDLEDLLACYLSLNSDEYHDVIIKVFKQLWFDMIRHPK